jgi:hypothetical protein
MGGQDIDLLRRVFALKIQIYKLPPLEFVQFKIQQKIK